MIEFIAVLLGCLNTFLLASVIYVLKQPNPSEGRELSEIMELKTKIEELTRTLTVLEKRLENQIQESKSESLATINNIKNDVSRQLQEIHDNL